MDAHSPHATIKALIVRLGERDCALPLSDVIEVMRPQPLEALPEGPAYLLGLALLRGRPTPVLDLARLLDGRPALLLTRFVLLRAGERVFAVGVKEVGGVREIGLAALEALPGLLHAANADVVESVGALDARLLVVLRAARMIGGELWQQLEERRVGHVAVAAAR